MSPASDHELSCRISVQSSSDILLVNSTTSHVGEVRKEVSFTIKRIPEGHGNTLRAQLGWADLSRVF